MKTKIVSCHPADSKPVKQEVDSTVILPPLVFADLTIKYTPRVLVPGNIRLGRRHYPVITIARFSFKTVYA